MQKNVMYRNLQRSAADREMFCTGGNVSWKTSGTSLFIYEKNWLGASCKYRRMFPAHFDCDI